MIILVDKPSGYLTSDVLNKLKKIFFNQKIWHSWTLDPLASGLLIFALWKDTKKLKYYINLPKEYISIFDFTLETDTWDLDYKYYCKKYDFKKVDINYIDYELKLITGRYVYLDLPYYSSKKLNWKRLYEYAYLWKYMKKSSKMYIYSYKILSYNFPYLKIYLKVWSWTYIRSIANYIWKRIGLVWSVVYLRRLSIWKYTLFQ